MCHTKLEKRQKKYCSAECQNKYLKRIKLKKDFKEKSFKEKVDIFINYHRQTVDMFFLYIFLSMPIIMLVIFILLYFILLSTNILSLGIDISTYTSYLIGMLYVLLATLIMKYYVTYFIKKKFKKTAKFIEEKINLYVIATFFIIGLLLLVGTSIIKSEFQEVLPRTNALGQISDSQAKINHTLYPTSRNYCESVNKYINYVKDDMLKCQLNITYIDQAEYRLRNVSILYEYMDETNEYSYVYNTAQNSYTYYINLTEKPYQHNTITLTFENSTGEQRELYYWKLSISPLSEEDYKDLQKQKIPIFLALITISIFSVIAAMRNLKDLIGD